MISSTLYTTGIMVTETLGVPVHLTVHALDHLSFLVRGLKPNSALKKQIDCINVFIVFFWSELHKEHWQRLLSDLFTNVADISYNMALL
jgi:hypothetical protein